MAFRQQSIKDQVRADSQRRVVSGYCDTGDNLFKQGKNLQALEYYQAALEIDSQCAEAWTGLASVFRALGRVNKADEAQRQAVALLRKTVNLNKIERKIKKLLAKYRRVAWKGVCKTGENAFGINIYGFSGTALAKLKQIEDEIMALNAYFEQPRIDQNSLINIRKQCLDRHSKRSFDKKLRRLWRSYKWLIWNSIVKSGVGTYKMADNPKTRAREKALRDKIIVLDVRNGNAWCNETTQKLLKARKNLPRIILKVLKIIGIVVAIAVALLIVYFILKYLVYIIIGGILLLAVIGFIND